MLRPGLAGFGATHKTRSGTLLTTMRRALQDVLGYLRSEPIVPILLILSILFVRIWSV